MKMKKIINVCLVLMMCLCYIFTLSKTAVAAVSENEASSLKNLLTKYYDDGYYQKDTIINLNNTVMSEAKGYFHVETYLERTTLFDGNELYMTNESGSINSGYGTNEHGDMIHFTKKSSGLKVVDYTVKIPNAGGMEEYYYTLKDLLELDYSEWSYSNGVYTYEPENPVNSDEWFTIFRDITAPCFLNSDDKSSNYISFSKITIEEKYNRLLLKLYVGETDYAKLTEEHQTDLCFSQATIVGGHLVDLGTVGGSGTPQYNLSLIRTIDSVVIEATTNTELTSNGLDKIEIFMNFDKFYDVGGNGKSTRTSNWVLFNIFSSGLIRGWNYPNAKQTQLFSEAKNKVTCKGVDITNTVTISNSGLNKVYFEVPYAFFEGFKEEVASADSLGANSRKIDKSSPMGIYFISGRKTGNNSDDTWVSKDNWSVKNELSSGKNYPSDLTIVGHDNKLYKNYHRYTLDVVSSFERLSSYMETVYGKALEGNMASFDTTKYTTKVYEPGALLFSDRTNHKVPDDGGVKSLNGLTYIYDSVGGSDVKVTATKSGYFLLGMADDNIKTTVISNWDFVVKSRLQNFGISLGTNTMSLYVTWVEAGDTITVPKNAILLTR